MADQEKASLQRTMSKSAKKRQRQKQKKQASLKAGEGAAAGDQPQDHPDAIEEEVSLIV